MAPDEIVLRDYQQECVDICDSLESGSHLVQMATGLGKTVTFSRIARKGRVLLLSHREELVTQPVKYYSCPVGIEKAERHSHGEEVVSASVQTLANRLEGDFEPGEFDMVITDEAHHALAPSYRKIYDYLRPRVHIGFTATPRRGDDRGLGAVFDDIVFQKDLRWGIANGYLCDIDCRRTIVDWSTKGVRTGMGDFRVGELARRVDRPETNRQVAAAYNELHIGQTLVFASSVHHAYSLAELIPGSVVVDGNTPADERRQIIDAFTARKIPCLINYGVFTEGTDMPLIETVLLARPTKNPSLYTQMVGRGLRLYTDPVTGYEKRSLRLIDCLGVSDDKSICTPPTLFGLNERDFPDRVGKKQLDGSLLDLGRRVEEVEDCPSGWVLSSRKVNVLSSTGSIAWVIHYNGDRNIAGPGASDRGWQVTLYKPDLLDCCTADLMRLGETQRRYYRSLDVAEQDILLWLESNYETSHDRALWDRERAAKWAEDPASEPQLTFIRRLLGDSAGDLDFDNLTKRDATIVIECAKRRVHEKNLRKYGACPICGSALKVSKSGKSIVCESNSWEYRDGSFVLASGCGFQVKRFRGDEEYSPEKAMGWPGVEERIKEKKR